MPTKAKAKKPVKVPAPRQILVEKSDRAFIITVPEDAKTTFGPWVPPGMRSKDRSPFVGSSPADAMGTLRVYGRTEKHILGVFSGVTGFRDLSLGYWEIYPDVAKASADGEYAEDVIVRTPKKAVYDHGPLPSPTKTKTIDELLHPIDPDENPFD